MKAFTIIALLLAVATVQASSAQASLTKINSQEHGKALINMVALNLKLKVPVGNVVGLLNDLKKDLTRDYNVQADAHNRGETLLGNAIKTGGVVVEGIQNVVADLTASISNLQNLVNSASATAAANAAERQAKQETLDALEAEHPEEYAQLTAEIAAVSDAIDASNRAVELIGQLVSRQAQEQGAASLIQLSSQSKAGLKALAEKLNKIVKKTGLSPLISELVELATNAQMKDASRIVDLVQNLISLLQESEVELRAERQTNQNNFDYERTNVNTRIRTLDAALAAAQVNVATWTATINTKQTEVANQNDLLADVQAQLAEDQQALQNLENWWTAYVPEQQNLISIVDSLVNQVQNNAGVVSQFSQVNEETA